jgi:hypothetical protein
MREYSMPDGTPVPAELQEKIAADVRDFDRAQTPEARQAVALRKISAELPRIRAAMTGEDQSVQARQATALEIMALSELGFPADTLRSTPLAQRLMFRYGLTGSEPLL